MTAEQMARAFTREEEETYYAQRRVGNRVASENQRQLRKWGVQDHDPSFFFLILMEEVGELATAIVAEDTGHAIHGTHRGILEHASWLGRCAQGVLEGKMPDRINGASVGHTSGEEAIQVAAVAVAMEENRERRERQAAA